MNNYIVHLFTYSANGKEVASNTYHCADFTLRSQSLDMTLTKSIFFDLFKRKIKLTSNPNTPLSATVITNNGRVVIESWQNGALQKLLQESASSSLQEARNERTVLLNSRNPINPPYH